MSGASAEAMLASISSPSNAHRMVRLSIPPAAMITTGANKAASSAGSDIISPAVPVEVSRLAAMVVSRPTGSISVVTTEKVAKPTAITASQECAVEEVLVVADVFMIQIPEVH
ncbi:hypothetical protein D3C77_395140 [compost metagenome]